MSPQIYSIDDVFGICRNLPLNYVSRESADDAFINSLARKKHVVIYGSSKQGKTSLRKKCLLEDDCIVISCTSSLTIGDLNIQILKHAGYKITNTTIGASGRTKLFAQLRTVFPLGDARASSEIEREHSEYTQHKELELDRDDVNDIIYALKKINFSRYIVLEDFHYLKPDIQQAFAEELKIFFDNSDISFIIIGVWLEADRLGTYNGDLAGRFISINADRWLGNELLRAITIGEELLNIRFFEGFKTTLIDHCFQSVSLVQEACHKCCMLEKILTTQNMRRENVGMTIDATKVLEDIVNETSGGRYNSHLENFAEGFQTTELEMFKWLLNPIFNATINDLEAGVTRKKISDTLNKIHPKRPINQGNITQALQVLNGLQQQKNIKPIIFDYDISARKLRVVDKGFLIWLSMQDISNLLTEYEINVDIND